MCAWEKWIFWQPKSNKCESGMAKRDGKHEHFMLKTLRYVFTPLRQKICQNSAMIFEGIFSFDYSMSTRRHNSKECLAFWWLLLQKLFYLVVKWATIKRLVWIQTWFSSFDFFLLSFFDDENAAKMSRWNSLQSVNCKKRDLIRVFYRTWLTWFSCYKLRDI